MHVRLTLQGRETMNNSTTTLFRPQLKFQHYITILDNNLRLSWISRTQTRWKKKHRNSQVLMAFLKDSSPTSPSLFLGNLEPGTINDSGKLPKSIESRVEYHNLVRTIQFFLEALLYIEDRFYEMNSVKHAECPIPPERWQHTQQKKNRVNSSNSVFTYFSSHIYLHIVETFPDRCDQFQQPSESTDWWLPSGTCQCNNPQAKNLWLLQQERERKKKGRVVCFQISAEIIITVSLPRSFFFFFLLLPLKLDSLTEEAGKLLEIDENTGPAVDLLLKLCQVRKRKLKVFVYSDP